MTDGQKQEDVIDYNEIAFRIFVPITHKFDLENGITVQMKPLPIAILRQLRILQRGLMALDSDSEQPLNVLTLYEESSNLQLELAQLLCDYYSIDIDLITANEKLFELIINQFQIEKDEEDYLIKLLSHLHIKHPFLLESQSTEETPEFVGWFSAIELFKKPITEILMTTTPAQFALMSLASRFIYKSAEKEADKGKTVSTMKKPISQMTKAEIDMYYSEHG